MLFEKKTEWPTYSVHLFG